MRYSNEMEHFILKTINCDYHCFAFPSDEVESAKVAFEDYATNGAIYLFLGCSGIFNKKRLGDVYIGKTVDQDGWKERITGPHDSIKYWYPKYWAYTFVFTTGDDSWTDSCVRYLERQFYLRARRAGHYNLVNKDIPYGGNGKYGKSSEEELTTFLRETEILLYDCGFPILTI